MTEDPWNANSQARLGAQIGTPHRADIAAAIDRESRDRAGMTPPAENMLERLRERVRSLELEAASARARYEEARDLLAMAEGRRRPRRMPELLQPPPDDAA
jgi:hypothetical protein